MSKVARGCRLPRGDHSPCHIALISCCDCMPSLACGHCYLCSCFSLEKLLFSRRAVFVSFLLPGSGRMKWLLVLLLCGERWRWWRRSTVERDCSFPYIPPTLRRGSLLLLKPTGRKWEGNKGKGSFACCKRSLWDALLGRKRRCC